MIISERADKSSYDFENLLTKSYTLISQSAKDNMSYFLERTPIDLEEDIYHVLCKSSKGTDFENTIHLVSGHKFPDITIRNYYGVEVKTTKSNTWRSTGNSVLESTRINNIERIYLFFAKLHAPVDFKIRLYQDCLYDVAVTHSPRYLINMELPEGESIFNKIGLSYDKLRLQANPIKQIVQYYRSISKQGEEPWWMEEQDVVKPTVRLWSSLSGEVQKQLRNEAFVRFPEVLGSHNRTKYQRLATWLAARHGVVAPSLRDSFSAGGTVNIDIGNTQYKALPRIFQHFTDNISEIINMVENFNTEEAYYYWNLKYIPSAEELIALWAEKIIFHTRQLIIDSKKFAVHLLGYNCSEYKCPAIVRDYQTIYGIPYEVQ